MAIEQVAMGTACPPPKKKEAQERAQPGMRSWNDVCKRRLAANLPEKVVRSTINCSDQKLICLSRGGERAGQD